MPTCDIVADLARAGAIALAFTFLGPVPSWASGPVAGILACDRIADSSSRLACFDREAVMLRNLSRAPSCADLKPDQPSRNTAAVHSAGLNPQQTFGLPPMKILAREEAAERLPPQLDRITADIKEVSKAADGRDIFTLDNHEVWVQLVPDADLYAKPGDVVEISRAALGSYWLSLKSRRGGCKVTRLR